MNDLIMSKPAGKCVFCGGARLTKEHIWSDWLKNVIPASDAHIQFRTYTAFEHEARVAFVRPYLDGRQGSQNQRKLRNVCLACNGGWMHDIVDLAKPPAEKIVRGEHIVLSARDQINVATWITISSIMAEFTDVKTQAIPASERIRLKSLKAPLDNWTISVGRYEGKGWSPMRYRHHGTEFIRTRESPPRQSTIASSKRGYMQVSNIVLGNAFFHVFSSTDADLVFHFRTFWNWPGKLIRIWPNSGRAIDWLTLPLLADADLEVIGDSYFMGQVHRKP